MIKRKQIKKYTCLGVVCCIVFIHYRAQAIENMERTKKRQEIVKIIENLENIKVRRISQAGGLNSKFESFKKCAIEYEKKWDELFQKVDSMNNLLGMEYVVNQALTAMDAYLKKLALAAQSIEEIYGYALMEINREKKSLAKCSTEDGEMVRAAQALIHEIIGELSSKKQKVLLCLVEKEKEYSKKIDTIWATFKDKLVNNDKEILKKIEKELKYNAQIRPYWRELRNVDHLLDQYLLDLQVFRAKQALDEGDRVCRLINQNIKYIEIDQRIKEEEAKEMKDFCLNMEKKYELLNAKYPNKAELVWIAQGNIKKELVVKCNHSSNEGPEGHLDCFLVDLLSKLNKEDLSQMSNEELEQYEFAWGSLKSTVN